jgi:gliding motility-associated protein GldL
MEAIIFFLSAFEPLHEELDWTLVYPELAGMTDPDELEMTKDTTQLSKSNLALERFDDLMGGLGGIDPNLIKNLGSSFEKLNVAAAGISEVSQATNVTTQFVENVSAAAESVGNLSLSFQQSAAGLQQSASAISNSSTALTAINDSSRGYANQMETMNKNIAQLNAIYEMQLLSTNEQMQKNKGCVRRYGTNVGQHQSVGRRNSPLPRRNVEPQQKSFQFEHSVRQHAFSNERKSLTCH